MKEEVLGSSRALWNRSRLDLESDEVLAQLLDRGEMADWRVLYRMAKTDPRLHHRIMQIILTVPLPLPHFWMAALTNLSEPTDWNVKLPDYFKSSAL